MKKLKVVILGGGNRGNRYAAHFNEHPEQFEIVAMADPNRSLAVDIFMKKAIESVKMLAMDKIRLVGAEGKGL